MCWRLCVRNQLTSNSLDVLTPALILNRYSGNLIPVIEAWTDTCRRRFCGGQQRAWGAGTESDRNSELRVCVWVWCPACCWNAVAWKHIECGCYDTVLIGWCVNLREVGGVFQKWRGSWGSTHVFPNTSERRYPAFMSPDNELLSREDSDSERLPFQTTTLSLKSSGDWLTVLQITTQWH